MKYKALFGTARHPAGYFQGKSGGTADHKKCKIEKSKCKMTMQNVKID
jgi:hypothetical protein